MKLAAEQIRALGIQSQPAEEVRGGDFIVVQGRIVPVAGRRAPVTAPFAGRFVASAGTALAVGHTVRQGQLLGAIEQVLAASESLQIAERRIALAGEVDRSRREFEQRNRDLERARKLLEGGVIPLKQVQQAELDASLARTRLEEARQAQASYDQLEKDATSPRRVDLKAPLAGTLLEINVTPGQQVDPSRPLFDIADLTTVWVEARVYENYLPRVREARSVEVVLPSDRGRRYPAAFVSSTRQVDPASRTEGFLYSVDNRGGRLALGAFADVHIRERGAGGKTELRVPLSAVFRDEEGAGVFVEVQPGVYQRRAVETGQAQEDRVSILSGLRAGEKVVASGTGALRSAAALGTRVE